MQSIVFSIILIFFSFIQNTNAATVPVHDPSIVIVYKDASGNSFPTNNAAGTLTKYYYVFGTQNGAAYSSDMLNWTSFTPPFSISGTVTTNYYNLVKPEADYTVHTTSADVIGNLWAPDVIYNKAMGKWTMYFSLSRNDFKSSIILFIYVKQNRRPLRESGSGSIWRFYQQCHQCGPFIVPDTVLPCGLSTNEIIKNFGNNVAVYKLTNAITVDIRSRTDPK